MKELNRSSEGYFLTKADRARRQYNKAMKASSPWRPTKRDLSQAVKKTVPDLIAPDLKVLFVGINPGLYSAATRRHFARPGNRFWPALYAAGFTPRILSPFEEHELLRLGCGITNLVSRASAAADELSKEELIKGAARLTCKIRKYRPAFAAIVGVGAYRLAFQEKMAQPGPQSKIIAGTQLWVLPNPSGLNAHYRPADLAKLFRQLRLAAERQN